MGSSTRSSRAQTWSRRGDRLYALARSTSRRRSRGSRARRLYMKLDFDSADERRVLADGRVLVEVVHVGAVPVLRVTHAPGWRWSAHSAPAIGTERCGNVHVGVMISGRMMVEQAGAAAYELRQGDAFVIPAGHDAWTVGDLPAVLVQVDEGASAHARYGG